MWLDDRPQALELLANYPSGYGQIPIQTRPKSKLREMAPIAKLKNAHPPIPLVMKNMRQARKKCMRVEGAGHKLSSNLAKYASK